MEVLRRLLHSCTQGAGPHVARALHLAIALVGVLAWASWWVQLDVLLSADGLLPAAERVAGLLRADVSFAQFPSLLRWTGASLPVLHGLCALGTLTCLLALAGIATRFALGLNAVLYLSFVQVSGPFAAFQWDNLMVECFVLGALLPREGGRLAHLALRLLFVRLYFGSGMAKLQSPLGDWLDGSAMTFYYETTPLPTPLSWWMHQLPAAWHHVESWATLLLEIVLPWGAFGTRRVRHVTAAAFTAFQVVNLLTGNFGFFVYLSLALHLALLDDSTLARVLARLPELRLRRPAVVPSLPRLRNAAVGLLLMVGLWEQSFALFGAPESAALNEARMAYLPLRVVNTYALFASVTRARIEPIVEIDTGAGFEPFALRYKPGPADRPLVWVAPHQPRVDFRLWFYGLRSRSQPPYYVQRLLRLACTQPDVVQPLFAEPLPKAPRAVRVRFEDYRFSDWQTRQRTGLAWQVGASRVGPGVACQRLEGD